MSTVASCLSVLDDVTIPQFFLDNIAGPDSSEQPCFVNEDTIPHQTLSRHAVARRVDHFANGLHLMWRLGEDDVVLIFSPNHIDYPTCIWATHRLGAIVATSNPSQTVNELAYQIRLVQPTLVICHPDLLSTTLVAAEQCSIPRNHILLLGNGLQHVGKSSQWTVDDIVDLGKVKIAFLCFSSGTTGPPKAVAISHHNVIADVLQVAAYNQVDPSPSAASASSSRFQPGDVCAGAIPLYHIYGLVIGLHFTFYARITLLISQSCKFERLLSSILDRSVTHLLIVPSQAVLFCKHPAVAFSDLSGIKYCLIGGAPVSSGLMKELTGVMPNASIGQAYGMTETTGIVSMFPPTQRTAVSGSAGRLLPGVTARVVKADGTVASPGETGELLIKGGQVAMGYYKNEKATRETFIDGWLRTGDEVFIRPDGELFVVDRIKEMIKVKGLQVAPAELEGHLITHPDVADAAVVGIPDDFAGELPFAFIVLHQESAQAVSMNAAAAAKLKNSIFQHVACAKSPYKQLTGGIAFCGSIPKNPSGKILRRILREQCKAREAFVQPVRAHL